MQFENDTFLGIGSDKNSYIHSALNLNLPQIQGDRVAAEITPKVIVDLRTWGWIGRDAGSRV